MAPSPRRRVPRPSPSARPTMSRSFMHRAGAALVLAGVSFACSRIHPVASTEPAPARASTLDRMTVRTGEQAVVVDSPAAAGPHLGGVIHEDGGYFQRPGGGSAGHRRGEGPPA